MRIRAMMFALVATAVMGIGASGASAATLYTDGMFNTLVAANTAVSATATSPVVLTSATSALNTCTSSTLSGTVTDNGSASGRVTGNITSGSVAGCAPFSAQVTFPSAWQLTVTGTPTTTSGFTVWHAQLHNVRFDLNNGPYSGTLDGFLLRQGHDTTAGPGPAGASCLQLSDTGTLTGPLTGNGRIDTNYCFTGAAASWRLR